MSDSFSLFSHGEEFYFIYVCIFKSTLFLGGHRGEMFGDSGHFCALRNWQRNALARQIDSTEC